MAETPANPEVLPRQPRIGASWQQRLVRDFDRFAHAGLPSDWPAYVLHEYDVDLSARYGGRPLRVPWGKASGQLSMTAHQVDEDIAAGLGFVVLKTVIAESASGSQSMKAWAIPESRMVAEPIRGARGEMGWTVSWKGRGWWHSFDDYLKLIRDAQARAAGTSTLIVPSCKYHLPQPGESTWREDEYTFTTARLQEAWGPAGPMPLEKDFSPTLAGSDLAKVRDTILDWLRHVPELVRAASLPDRPPPELGLKLFNALFDDAFQLEMLRTVQTPGPGRPDFFVYGNRLFDPQREFDGHRGIAYGGPDLSDRNLRVMTAFRSEDDGDATASTAMLPWSATGNICTGRLAMEYALRGATSFQLHTFFQLPSDEYVMRTGTKTAKALHMLMWHPESGLLAWMRHVADQLGVTGQPLRFLDVVGRLDALQASADGGRF